jgi:uncharacterized membrane protein
MTCALARILMCSLVRPLKNSHGFNGRHRTYAITALIAILKKYSLLKKAVDEFWTVACAQMLHVRRCFVNVHPLQ